MGRPVVHWELWSKDPGEVAAFYSKVFEWSAKPIPELGYTFIETGGSGGINGGVVRPMDGPWPGNMSLYIDVEDLAACRRRIVEAGGRILVEEQQIPGMGAFSLFTDPDGRVAGIWQRER